MWLNTEHIYKDTRPYYMSPGWDLHSALDCQQLNNHRKSKQNDVRVIKVGQSKKTKKNTAGEAIRTHKTRASENTVDGRGDW